jgi:hypothetical protein
MRGPITPTKAWGDCMPKSAIDTAIANSKLFPVAVNDIAAFFPYGKFNAKERKKLNKNMNMKYINSGTAIVNTSVGTCKIDSPFTENMMMMVNSKAYNVIGEILGMNVL